MAAGMHASASGQLGPCFDHSDIANPLECAALQGVEIKALSEERSLEAEGILQERGLQTRPMGRYSRMLHRKERPEESKRSHAIAAAASAASSESNPSTVAGAGCEMTNSMWRILVSQMPILQVLSSMTLHTFRADIIAGLTVGVMVIPQSMSYASIAGLPYIYGMYSACVPTFVYAFFGQSRQLAVGPVAMVSLLIEAGLRGLLTQEECPSSFIGDVLRDDVSQAKECPEAYAGLAINLALLVGLLQIAARLLKLGFLVSFLGHPVTSGFTSAAAIIIGLSQLKYILGVKAENSDYFIVTVKNIAMAAGETSPITLCLGITWIVFLLGCKTLAKRGGPLKLLGPLAPLIGCAVGSILLFACAPLRDHVGHVGYIPEGMFPVSLTTWKLSAFARVWPTALSACLIGYMESIAIGKNLAAKHGHDIDAGQELMALGMANLVGAVFSCFPVTGSFSRSAVANTTGALTQVAGLVTSLIMLGTLVCLTKLFFYLPNFVLAAIVISSVIPLVAYNEAMKLYRIKKQDFVLWMTAFVGTLLLGVLAGIALAVVLSLVIVIYESVRPQITILWRIPGTTIYRPLKQEPNGVFIPNVFIARIGSSMYFANASFIKDVLLAYVTDLETVNRTEYIVLEMTPVVSLDSTAIHVLQDVVNAFRTKGIQIAFAMVGNRVDKTLRKAGLKKFIGDQWFFPTVNEAVIFCLRHQEAKRMRSTSQYSFANSDNPDMTEIANNPVHPGDEIGFSNDLHHNCTAIFINLVKDVPMLMSIIAATFSDNHITVRRAQIQAAADGEGAGDEEGTKHTYFVRSVRHPGKLFDWEISALRAELMHAIHREAEPAFDANPQAAFIGEERVRALKQALERERADNDKMRAFLTSATQRVESSSLREHSDVCARPVLEGNEGSNISTCDGPEDASSSSGEGAGFSAVSAAGGVPASVDGRSGAAASADGAAALEAVV